MNSHTLRLRGITCRPFWRAVAAALLLLPTLSWATEVRIVAVTPGRSADVVIDGGAPLTIEVGETVEGVKLLRADGGGAVVSVDGATKQLPVVAHASGNTDGSTSVTLTADARGQFFTSGTVNGRAMRFVVDTGATMTSLSRADAKRIGLDYQSGRPAYGMTVNGAVKGWAVSLGSVRVGNVTEHNVEAVVVDNDLLPVGLLGMSFLNRFNMHRNGSTLVLRQRH